MTPFALCAEDVSRWCREVQVVGELDRAVSGRLLSALDEVAADRDVLVNLSACEFLDSSGLAVLVRTRRRLRERGRHMLICGARGQVERLLVMTGVTEAGLLATDHSGLEGLAGSGLEQAA